MKTKTKFGPIYALASNGKIKMWQAIIRPTDRGAYITYKYGYEDGQQQTQMREVFEGKNLGKKNETTAFDQASKDAESKYNKKCDAGYQEDKDELTTPILPMLAHPYSKRKHNIVWPCFTQPKIDGVRCTFTIKNDEVVMFTRKGKQFTSMPHIINDIQVLYENITQLNYSTSGLYLDGEMYSDTLTFQELAGALRRHKNTDETLSQIYLGVFDIFYLSKDRAYDFEFRTALLDQFFEGYKNNSIKLIDTEMATDEAMVHKQHQEHIEAGYEGIMLRNSKGAYKLNHRSADLQKLKMFQDEEFEIIDFADGVGVEEGCVIWGCLTKDNKGFAVRPKGTHAERKELFKHGHDYVGKQLTVRYQELTDDGKPRFPVGISIRDYE
jgi:ATP-dependent DNA ligase